MRLTLGGTRVAGLTLAVVAGCGDGGPRARLVPFDSAGVEVTPLDSIAPCDLCDLTPVLEVRLGVAEGPGMAEGDVVTVHRDPSSGNYAAIWEPGPLEVDLYDREGTYLRSIGRAGDGPGEFSRFAPSRLVYRDGVLTVMDYPSPDWLVFRDDGTLIQERPIRTERSGSFIALSPDTVLLRGSPGVTVHALVSLSALEVVGEVPHAVFQPPGEPVSFAALAGGRTPWTIATASPDALTIKEWALDGSLLRVLRGAPTNYPALGGVQEEGQPPRPRLGDIQFDGEGRLWTVTYVPADTWREFDAAMAEYRAESGGGRSGFVEISVTAIQAMPRRVAPRVDVFDLEAGLHLGSWVSEARTVGLIEADGEVLAYQMELLDELYPSAAVYRFDLAG